MSKAPSDKSRKEVSRYIDKWRSRLFLHEWFIDVDYPKEDLVLDDGRSGDVLAEVDPDPVYKNARIKIYPAWFRKERKVREFAVVHELCHCHTQEMRGIAGSLKNGVLYHDHQIADANESLTQRVALIAFRDEWGPK